MVVLIVFLGVMAKMYDSRQRHRRARHDDSPPADEARLARLEERVEVLERIVTDSGYDLRRQFRELEREEQRRA
jgi:hypothetical protein